MTLADCLRASIAALESSRSFERDWPCSDQFWRDFSKALGEEALPPLPRPALKSSVSALLDWGKVAGIDVNALPASLAFSDLYADYQDSSVNKASLLEAFAGALSPTGDYGRSLSKHTVSLLAAVTLLEHAAPAAKVRWPAPRHSILNKVEDSGWEEQIPERLHKLYAEALAHYLDCFDGPEIEVPSLEQVCRQNSFDHATLDPRPDASLHFNFFENNRYWEAVRVEIIPTNTRLEVRTRCPHRRRPTDLRICVALALEQYLRFLLDPYAPMRAIAEAVVGHAPWERFLTQLAEKTPASPTKKAAPQRLTAQRVQWQLSEAYGWHREGKTCDLNLTPLASRILKNGKWSAPARRSPAKLLSLGGLDDDDAKIAQLLDNDGADRNAGMMLKTAAAVLPLLALRDDVTFSPDRRGSVPCVVSADAAGVRVQAVADQLCIELVAGGRTLANEMGLKPQLRVLVHDQETPVVVQLVEVSRPLVNVAALLPEEGALLMPQSAGVELAEALLKVEAQGVRIELPESLDAEQIASDDLPIARLERLSGGGVAFRLGHRPLPGGPMVSPDAGLDRLLGVRGEQRVAVQRDLEAERTRLDAIVAQLEIDDDEQRSSFGFLFKDVEAALDLVDRLRDLDEKGLLTTEWPHGSALQPLRGQAAQLAVRVQRKRDWFVAEGELTIDEHKVALAQLAASVRDPKRWVKVDDDTFVKLTDALRDRLRALTAMTREVRGNLEMGPQATLALEGLQEEGVQVDEGAAYKALRARLEKARTVRPRVPASLRDVFRSYQTEGFQWLLRLAAWGVGGCLADDMGLGKTVQMLGAMSVRGKKGPQLVVAPTSVCGNWVNEANHFTPELNPILFEGKDRLALLKSLGPRDVLICSYAILVRESKALNEVAFTTAVFDEAQFLKNRVTKRNQAARALNAEWSVALTGTPLENHLGDLWSLFSVVSPGLFGSWQSFSATFATPIERHRDVSRRKLLARTLQPFLLRRRKIEVATELPARTEIVIPVVQNEDERALYEAARRKILEEIAESGDDDSLGSNDVRFQVLAGLTRLRLLASHPRLDNPESTVVSSKLEAISQVVDQLLENGHRALIFSQFTKHLALVEQVLLERDLRYVKLIGSTPPKKRRELIDAFQAGEAEIFLISLKAGGTGLNLTAADYVLHLDPWWNPAAEDQATDRAHRIGQERPVTVYRFVSQGTIEEKIVDLHRDKRALVEDILSGTDRAGKLDTDDLLALMQDV